MTTANLLNISSVKADSSVQTGVSKKLQEENLEAASVFSALMNQQADYTDTVLGMENESSAVEKADGVTTAADSYERYNYKDNKIETVEKKDTVEVTEEIADEVQNLEESVIEVIAEEYGVDKETVLAMLDEMGLRVSDLFDTQNLAGFVMQLTGLSETEAVLFDDSFLNVMETLNDLKTELMKELDLTLAEFDEFVAQLKAFTTEESKMPQPEVPEVLDAPLETVPKAETVAKQTAETLETLDEQLETDSTKTVETESAENERTEEQKDVPSVETKTETSAEKQESESFRSTDSNESVVMNNHTQTVNAEIPKMQTSTYTSVEPMQIIEQIAEQVRVFNNTDSKTMEMQLNPENLGKIYLHISSEEGIVNAHFTATNEAVKEALEMQFATLRENLTQAGVKVDAIEVTIASHEFEQNLEQNHGQTEESQQKDAVTGKRRNLSMDSLDELSGIMTEEEMLATQIMKENGNSVDLTA